MDDKIKKEILTLGKIVRAKGVNHYGSEKNERGIVWKYGSSSSRRKRAAALRQLRRYTGGRYNDSIRQAAENQLEWAARSRGRIRRQQAGKIIKVGIMAACFAAVVYFPFQCSDHKKADLENSVEKTEQGNSEYSNKN